MMKKPECAPEVLKTCPSKEGLQCQSACIGKQNTTESALDPELEDAERDFNIIFGKIEL